MPRIMSFICWLGVVTCLISCSSSPETKAQIEAAKAKAERRRLINKFSPRQSKAKSKKVLVLNPINKTEYGGKELEDHTKEIIQEWMETQPDFVYVHPEDINTKNKKLTTEEKEFDLDAIFDLVNDTGLSAVLLPTIEEISFKEEGEETGLFRDRTTTTEARVQLTVYDLNTQKEILTQRKTAKYAEDGTRFLGTDENNYNKKHGKIVVTKAFLEILERLPKYAKRIDWSGLIAKIEAPRFYVDAGRTTGLKRGQLLKVYGAQERIKLAGTADLLGNARGRYKGTLRIVDYFGEDGAIAILHSGGGFVEKDRVELYLPRHTLQQGFQ